MAEYAIVINAEDIAKATVYTDISIKEALARGVAQLCVEPVDVISDDTEALPPMFRENRKLRAQFQMGILASLLGREYEKQTVIVRGENGSEERPLAWCMDEDDYRKCESSHVMNQLERMKKAKVADADRIFDFLYDYKAVYQVGGNQFSLDGNGTLHQVGEDDSVFLAGDGHHIAHHDVFFRLGIFINSRKAHRRLLYFRLASTAVSRRLPFSKSETAAMTCS